jgi:hypothetical protein
LEIPVNTPARLIGLRLTGNLSQQVEIFGVEADIHAPALSNQQTALNRMGNAWNAIYGT